MKNKKNLIKCKEFISEIAEIIFLYFGSDNYTVEVRRTYTDEIEKILKKNGFTNQKVDSIDLHIIYVTHSDKYRIYINEYSIRNSYNQFEITKEELLNTLNN